MIFKAFIILMAIMFLGIIYHLIILALDKIQFSKTRKIPKLTVPELTDKEIDNVVKNFDSQGWNK
jgi:hypothetical protein